MAEKKTSEFVDKRGRTILIVSDDDWPPTVFALHKHDQIGVIRCGLYDDGAILEEATVQHEYQRAGIGVRMMQEAVERDPLLTVPSRTWRPETGHEYFLTVEGAKLFNACIREGVLRPEAEIQDVHDWRDKQD